jgi:hypothetical protein
MITLHLTKEELVYLKELLTNELRLLEEFIFIRKEKSPKLIKKRELCINIVNLVKKKHLSIKRKEKRKDNEKSNKEPEGD